MRVSSLLPAASSFSVQYLVLRGLAINAVGGDRATATSRVSVTTEKFNEQVPNSPASPPAPATPSSAETMTVPEPLRMSGRGIRAVASGVREAEKNQKDSERTQFLR